MEKHEQELICIGEAKAMPTRAHFTHCLLALETSACVICPNMPVPLTVFRRNFSQGHACCPSNATTVHKDVPQFGKHTVISVLCRLLQTPTPHPMARVTSKESVFPVRQVLCRPLGGNKKGLGKGQGCGNEGRKGG